MLLIYFGSNGFWALVMLALILLLAVILGIQAHRQRVQGGNEELRGMLGQVTVASDPRGRARALVRGEIWQVYCSEPLAVDQTVRVRKAQGLWLEVSAAHDRGTREAAQTLPEEDVRPQTQEQGQGESQ